MLSKEKIISDMLAVLAELQAISKGYTFSGKDYYDLELQAIDKRNDNDIAVIPRLLTRLELYCQILDDDVPEDFTEQIGQFIPL